MICHMSVARAASAHRDLDVFYFRRTYICDKDFGKSILIRRRVCSVLENDFFFPPTSVITKSLKMERKYRFQEN